MPARIAVIYYSSTGNVHKLAEAVAAGAEAEGAEVRLRRVAETAPAEAIDANETWREYVDTVAPTVQQVSLDDLEWADGIALGSPTRFGRPTSQFQSFIDTTGGLWSQGALASKVGTSFTSSATPHGGQESTILAINNTFYHWGCVVVPLGYADDEHLMRTGNPYGASVVGDAGADEAKMAERAAELQGARLTRVTAKLAA